MFIHYDKTLGKAIKYEKKRREFDYLPLTAESRERAINYALEDTKPMLPMSFVAFFADIVFVDLMKILIVIIFQINVFVKIQIKYLVIIANFIQK